MFKFFWGVLLVSLTFPMLCSCNTRAVSVDLAQNELSLSSDMSCSYQYGEGARNEPLNQNLFKRDEWKEKTPLIWKFSHMNEEQPSFDSGGDTGKLIKWQHPVFGEGISMFLPQGNGAHLFSIWPNGVSIWSKHNNLLGSLGASQFVGVCKNIQ